MSSQPIQPMPPGRSPTLPARPSDDLLRVLDEQARLAQTLRDLLRQVTTTPADSADPAPADSIDSTDSAAIPSPTNAPARGELADSACAWLDELRSLPLGQDAGPISDLADVSARALRKALQTIGAEDDATMALLDELASTIDSMIGEFCSAGRTTAPEQLLSELRDIVADSEQAPANIAPGALTMPEAETEPEPQALTTFNEIEPPLADTDSPAAPTAEDTPFNAIAPASPDASDQQPPWAADPAPDAAAPETSSAPETDVAPEALIAPAESSLPLDEFAEPSLESALEPSLESPLEPEPSFSSSSDLEPEPASEPTSQVAPAATPEAVADAPILDQASPDPSEALSALSAQLAALADRIELPESSSEPAAEVFASASEPEQTIPAEDQISTDTDSQASTETIADASSDDQFASVASAMPIAPVAFVDPSVDPQLTLPHPPSPTTPTTPNTQMFAAAPAIAEPAFDTPSDSDLVAIDGPSLAAPAEPADAPLSLQAEVSTASEMLTEPSLDASDLSPPEPEPSAADAQVIEPTIPGDIEPDSSAPATDDAFASEPGVLDPIATAPSADDAALVDPAQVDLGAFEPGAPAPDQGMPSGELTPEQMAALLSGGLDPTPGDAQAVPSAQWGSFPLTLDAARVEQLQFMVANAKVHLENLNAGLAQAAEFSTRADGCQSLRDLATAVDLIAEAFNFECLGVLSRLYREALNALPTVSDETLPELLARIIAIAGLFEQHLLGLEVGMEMRWQTELLSRRMGRLCSSRSLAENIAGWHKGEVTRILELDAVNEPISPVPIEGGPSVEVAPGWFCHPVLARWFDPEAAAAAAAAAASAGDQKQAEGNTSLVRVPGAVLDKLLDTVSQLVLSKNRVVSLSRSLRQDEGRQHRMEELATTADDLTQLCADLQLIMMQARMQPVGKLFERYPRVIRDVASVADKTVELKLEGGATLVDKHVFEGLGEPLANLLRAVVQGSIEKTDARAALNKPASAVLVLRAENQGSQVLITLTHDGTSPDRVSILQKAVESGVLTEDEMGTIAENDIPSLLFRDGAGDPAMAKVGSQVRSIGGTIGFRPERDGLNQLVISVPLSVAIIPAVMVQVAAEVYAVPLQSVAEIVRLADHPVQTIRSHWVMRLRERVVPMVDIARTIGLPSSLCAASAASTAGSSAVAAASTSKPQTLVGDRFAIVVHAGEQQAALVVDRVVGKQDVVIKQLEGHTSTSSTAKDDAGFFSGATIRDDGRVSLIFETARLIAAAQNDASENLTSISQAELESDAATPDIASAV